MDPGGPRSPSSGANRAWQTGSFPHQQFRKTHGETIGRSIAPDPSSFSCEPRHSPLRGRHIRGIRCRTMRKPKAYDLVVIGGGPAGLSAATTAAALGKIVALVDSHHELGGEPEGMGIVHLGSHTEINDLAQREVTMLREVTKRYVRTRRNVFEFSDHTPIAVLT